MRFGTVASLVSAPLLAAIITAIPVTQAWAEADSPATGAGATDGPPTPPPAAGAGATDVAGPGVSGAPATAPVPSAASSAGAGAATVGSDGGAVGAPPPRRMVASLSHDLQFGLAILIGDGYRGVFPYETDIDCGDMKTMDNRVCTNRAPAFIDVQPSFGIANAWDFLVDLRFGLTKDFNQHHQFYAMPGFRYWLDPQSQVKFFTTIQLAYDRSKQNNPPGAPHPVGDTDLGFRNSNGIMVEVMRNFGVYFQFGETIGFYRWLSFLVDAGVGVQARFP